MKAIRVHRFGSPQELLLEEVPRPAPGPGEILVQVHAAGVGPWDAWVRAGQSALPQPLPLTPGSDIAGIVAAAGPGAPVGEGEEVYGVTNPSFTNGYAQYAVARGSMMARKPRQLSFIESASVPVIAVTAWQMFFEHARLRKGQTVLIHGGAGNVGAFAVQLAHHAGIHVVATDRAGDGTELRRLGADEVLIGDELIPGSTSDVDAVIDTVGGPGQRGLFPLVRRGGSLVSAVNRPDGDLARQHEVQAVFFIVNVTTAYLERIAALLDAGTLSVRVGTVLELAQARQAHEMLEGARPKARGKIVLRVD
jgi:NADPH:quinone reductase-like Zn-dependent oxidoreductase